MSEFDPSEVSLVHDLLNDRTFAWLPEWRESYEKTAALCPILGVIEWDGHQLDGWCEPLGG